MTESVLRNKAMHLVTRMQHTDLEDSDAFDAAVDHVSRLLASMVAAEPMTDLLDDLQSIAEEAVTSEASRAVDQCIERVRELEVAYEYSSMDEWWDSTSYQDEIGVDDQVFRDKPIHLRRIALEAFNAARRAHCVEAE